MQRRIQAMTTEALLILVVVGAVAGVSAATQQQARREVISVNDPRPLAELVLALEQRFGAVITYEDPPYNETTERVDVSESVRPDRGLKGVRSYIPRGGPFSFEYSVKPGSGSEQLGGVLTRLLQQYRRTDYEHAFELQRTDAMYHVIPVGRRADNGRDEDYEAILSTDVQLIQRGEARSAYVALMDLVSALELASGVRMFVGSAPVNLLNRTEVSDPPAHSPARSELLRILRATGERLSWRWLYNPNAGGRFYLNIHLVGSPFAGKLLKKDAS